MRKQRSLFLSILLTFMPFAVSAVNDATVEIPQGCVSWFDGCNICVVGEFDEKTGEYQLVCTKKYCPPEVMKQPSCLSYEEEDGHH